MSSSGISSERTHSMNLSSFWKKNEPLLREIERSEMPPKSRLVYKEITNNTHATNNHLRIYFDLVNIYNNRKNFFEIVAEIALDSSSIVKEEIIAGKELCDAKKP
jgi:hypothetical protein